VCLECFCVCLQALEREVAAVNLRRNAQGTAVRSFEESALGRSIGVGWETVTVVQTGHQVVSEALSVAEIEA
jgi:hypothetical protein